MVHVNPDSLRISPVDPTTTTRLIATATVNGDWFNMGCDSIAGYTRTYIRLLRRNVDTNQMWTTASEVGTFDCHTLCCFDAWGNPFPIKFGDMKPILTPGTYEFMAVDESDYIKQSFQPDRTAVFTITVVPDPTPDNPCLANPCGEGCVNANTPMCQLPIDTTVDNSGGLFDFDTSTCDGDAMCQIKAYLPLILIGGVALLLLTQPKSKS